MSIVAWIILGLIAGAVANLLDPRPSQGGLLGALVLGVLGALIGGFLANLLFGITITGLNIVSVIVAVAGSLLLLWLGRVFSRA